MTSKDNGDLSSRFNLTTNKESAIENVDKKVQESNKLKVLRYLRSTPKYETMMQKEREIIKIKDVGTTMKSLIDADPNLYKLVNDKNNPIPDHLIKHTETLAKRRVVNAIARKQLGIFKYAMFTGKLGVDTFFLLFAAVGTIAIPTYFYATTYKVRNQLKKVNEKYKSENSGEEVDLDDISLQFTNMRVDEIRQEQLKKAKIYEQIDKLDKELYESRRV